MNYVLGIKGKTGQLIADELGIPFVRRLPADAEKTIRWGNTTAPDAETLNSVEAISLSADKSSSREVLSENGVRVPELIDTEDNAVYPVVGRPDFHTRGNAFFYCTNADAVRNAIARGATYFSHYIEKQAEYRVHIAGDKVLLFSVKEGGDTTHHVWNKRAGFKFRHLRRSAWRQDVLLMNIQREAKKAIAILGLQFGAVDIGVSNELPYVFEVNSAPALSPLAVTKYVEYFKGYLNG